MDKDILRRIAERGLRRAQEKSDSEYVDIFQHMLDELHQIEIYQDSETIRAFRKFAEKVHDPKLKDLTRPQALAIIATEIAEELEVESML